MSNRTQVLCNYNRIRIQKIKIGLKEIESDSITLSKLEDQKKELIIVIKETKPPTVLQMIRLGRILKEIRYYKNYINIIQDRIKEERSKLIIC